MTSLVLHIGSPKAGSSAIQASLADFAHAHRPWWPQRAWVPLPPNPYGRPYPSGFIAGLYLDPSSLPRYLRLSFQVDQTVFYRDCERYRRHLNRTLQPRLRPQPLGALLSCEYLWRFPRQAVENLRRDFESFGIQRFLVVAYVREPLSAYGSALQQWARLSTDFSRFDPEIWRYELRQRLETWAEVFPEALVVRPFDRQQLHEGCVVKDLKQRIRSWLADEDGTPALRSVATLNSAASTEALLAMQELMGSQPETPIINALRRSPSWRRLWESLAGDAAVPTGTPIRVKPAVAVRIRQRHQDDLDWLAEVHGVALPAAAKSDPAADPWLLTGGESAAPGLGALLLPPADMVLLESLRHRLAAVELPHS